MTLDIDADASYRLLSRKQGVRSMLRSTCPLSLVMVLCLGSLSCRGGEDDGGGSSLTEAALVGTWVDTDGDEFVFNTDGTMGGECDGEPDCEATWSIQENMLVVTWTDSGSGGGCHFSETTRFGMTAAVVNDVLYWPAMVRTSGSGASMDGTWSSSEEESEEEFEECDGERYSAEFEFSYQETMVISGDSFEMTETEHELYDEDGYREEDDEGSSSRGTIREEGDLIYITTTEFEGSPISPEELYERLFGIRLAPGAIYRIEYDDRPWEEVDPEDLGLRHR